MSINIELSTREAAHPSIGNEVNSFLIFGCNRWLLVRFTSFDEILK